ncbi:tetraspanin-33 isoform X2 [Synchiropus splendidus]|uniref:tetraspanin-33 isoform X2 n=1 Tax=Synchiropus splendidus TaxID=270530 RepID=UPI00237D60C3|nr:tetraspanin-33 isoform X2 [Synchiropus splendidus]
MGCCRGSAPRYGEDFTFVSRLVKYLLFLFNFIFWVISVVMVSIGLYARSVKHAEAALAYLSVDPAIFIMVVGILMFIITFCGCLGSLRENICLLQTFCISLVVIFILQLTAGILGFVFSDKAQAKVSDAITHAIEHYREDIDLQNLIDFGQREFGCCGGVTYTDWSENMYFNCKKDNPSRERCSVPFSCCLLSEEKGMQEMEYMEAQNYIYTDGCVDKLVNWIHSNLFMLGGIAMGLAIPQVGAHLTASQGVGSLALFSLQLIGILLSQILITQIKDQINLQQSRGLWR